MKVPSARDHRRAQLREAYERAVAIEEAIEAEHAGLPMRNSLGAVLVFRATPRLRCAHNQAVDRYDRIVGLLHPEPAAFAGASRAERRAA